MSNTDQVTSTPGGFGKMLNSLQGLQQRLEDFSIADVTNAEANAQTLILRLEQFQDTIDAIALLKKVAANIDQSIAEIQQPDTEVVGMDSLENHPQLNAIVKASKLIKLQKLMAALKSGADFGGSQEVSIPDPVAVALSSLEVLSDFPSEPSESTSPEPADQDRAGSKERAVEARPAPGDSEPAPLNGMTTTPSIIETAADSPLAATATNDTGPVNIDTLEDFPTAEAEFETAIAAATADSPFAEGPLPDFPAPVEQSADSQITLEQPILELGNDPPQTVKPKQNSHISPAILKGRGKEPGPVEQSKALVPANENFDLRLLHDLVSNYGEFASNPNLPATVKKKELQSMEPLAKGNNEAKPEQSSPVEATAPVIKKNVDLDRQLKKIIKDYGEYDIYSDKQTTNIKKAGILAFVFLGLVFGGIYLFITPPSTANMAPATSNNSSTKPDNQISRPDETGTTGDRRETALGATHDNEKQR